MSKGKKFEYRLTQNDSGWSADIIRRASSKKFVITKHQDNFSSESDAETWAKSELKVILGNVQAREKQRSAKAR